MDGWIDQNKPLREIPLYMG